MKLKTSLAFNKSLMYIMKSRGPRMPGEACTQTLDSEFIYIIIIDKTHNQFYNIAYSPICE